MRMYDYSEAYVQLEQALVSGEIDLETYQDTVKSLADSANDKAENLGKMIDNFAAQAEMLKKEEENLKKKRKTIEKRIEWLTNSLETYLKAIGKKSHKVGLYTLGYRNLPDVVEIEDENAVPDAYKKIETVVKIPKEAIKKAIQDGEEVTGAKLVTGREKFEVKK